MFSFIKFWIYLVSLSKISDTFVAGLEFPSHVMLGQSTSLKCSFTRAPSQKVKKETFFHEYSRKQCLSCVLVKVGAFVQKESNS